MTFVDEIVGAADRALRTLSGSVNAARGNPAHATTDLEAVPSSAMTEAQRRHAAALMRVNHVGEICAQALYEGQALGTSDHLLKGIFRRAADEEIDHLGWVRERIEELGGRPSLLNPLWYAGSFGFGLLASRIGSGASLGFMAETERQVEQHLQGHLQRLPEADLRSRAIVETMREDEARHGETARSAGALSVPAPVRLAMRLAAKVMTTVAHRI